MSPVTSTVIVTYNNWETTTRDCLKSLLAGGETRSEEIIVVDNNSQDQTPERLKEICAEHENVRIQLNTENRGFAGGNNDGVKMASGDIVVLLNSDTIVPGGAIKKLADKLRNHPEWGMLGPVTNQAGNEQKIYIQQESEKNIIEEGLEWCRRSGGDCFESPRLDFCCVAIRKNVYETLGGLDESYGLGYYEDTDFSLKASLGGFKMFFTEDVFIYHKAGESFAAHKKEAVKQLMKRNKRILKKKYGHQMKLYHMRDCNLRILREYVSQIKETASCQDVMFRFEKRFQFAKMLYPNNPFKKLRYWSALRGLEKFGLCR